MVVVAAVVVEFPRVFLTDGGGGRGYRYLEEVQDRAAVAERPM